MKSNKELETLISEYKNKVIELKDNIKDFEQSIASLENELDIRQEGKQGELL